MNLKPKDRISGLNTVLTVIFIVFSFWILALKNASMLKWYDEMSLFETNYLYFRRFLLYPGGLLRYAGTFLTQLLYYPWLGASVLIVLWLALTALTRTAFRFRRALFPLALLLPLCLLVSVVQLDEAWLSIKSTGYVFFNTLGYLVTLLLYLLFVRLKNRSRWRACVMLIMPLLYPVAGFFALLAAIISLIHLVSELVRKEKSILLSAVGVVALIFIIVVPQVYYIYFPATNVDNDYLYLKGLPELMMESYDIYLWIPFIIATALTVIFPIISALFGQRTQESIFIYAAGLILTVAGFIWALRAEHKSEQLRATVLMLRCAENNNWPGIMHIMSLTREQPNYTMLVLQNLARVNLGGKSYDLEGLYPSPEGHRAAETFTISAFIQVPVNYYIGRLNQSYRWAMEHTVQYGKRVFFLKYMVKDALLRGDIKVAEKYNDILLTTIFHRKWALEMKRYIDNPDLIKENPEFSTVLKMMEIEKLRGE